MQSIGKSGKLASGLDSSTEFVKSFIVEAEQTMKRKIGPQALLSPVYETERLISRATKRIKTSSAGNDQSTNGPPRNPSERVADFGSDPSSTAWFRVIGKRPVRRSSLLHGNSEPQVSDYTNAFKAQTFLLVSGS